MKYEVSFFLRPVSSKHPHGVMSLFQIYEYLRHNNGRRATEELRQLTDKDERRAYKSSHFDYVTFSGTFAYCNDQSLIKHSRLLCMDLDELGDRVEELFQILMKHPMTLLLFHSPGGFGLKWVIEIDLSRCDHKTWFTAMRNYLMTTYNLSENQVDKSCSNVSRACYLGYDPDAHLRGDLIEYF